MDADEPALLLSEDRHSGISHHFGFPFVALQTAIDRLGRDNIRAVGYSRDRNQFREPPADYFCDLLDPEEDGVLRIRLASLLDDAERAYPDLSRLSTGVADILAGLASGRAGLHLKKRLCYLVLRFVNELATEANIRLLLPDALVTGIRHHDTHAATFHASPFETATIVTWDGRGEFDSTVLYKGGGDGIERLATVQHPLSLGTFYEIFADYIGLGRIEGPGKLMGLAAYGDDRFVDVVGRLIEVDADGFDFRFDSEFLSWSQSERLSPMPALTGIIGPGRQRSEPIADNHKAIAFAVQRAIEESCCALIENAVRQTGDRNLVLSGGLSLNCVMNEKIRERLGLEPFLIPPCGDDGTALGAALALREQLVRDGAAGRSRMTFAGSYGTANDDGEIAAYLTETGLNAAGSTPREIADLLAAGKVIGFISGRYEFGPRALGFRSILADPRPYENWPHINDDIKFREDFRPFAPVMLAEEAERFWGEGSRPTNSPYMLLAPRMNETAAAELGAVTHRDRTARLQTVDPSFNPALHDVLTAFKQATGVGVLLNTSLNMSGESIIVDFRDLVRFMAFSDLDGVVLNGTLVLKAGNEDALTRIRTEIGDRSDYLANRRTRYADKLKAYAGRAVYMDFDQFFELLYPAQQQQTHT
jgi:carbamoyltransferase